MSDYREFLDAPPNEVRVSRVPAPPRLDLLTEVGT